jgi:HPt (histidine-containing phosphotransfer) domain-containing protein
MPGLDGYQMIQALRDHGLSVPVIVVAASEWQDDRLAARGPGAGIAGFLGKPASIPQLQAMLDRLFAEAPNPNPNPIPASVSAPTAVSAPAGARAAAPAAQPDVELYGLFQRTLDADLEVLRAALRHDDRPAFLRGAHKLKGALAILGEAALADACGQLSALARQQPLGRVQPALTHFETALTQAMLRVDLSG